jgi:WD40 repeat protein
MPRFSMTQMLMGVGLIAIVLSLFRSEGCGRREMVIESVSFSPDGARLLVSRMDSRRTGVVDNQYVSNQARTISVLDAASGDATIILRQDVRLRGREPPLGQWNSGRASAYFSVSAASIIVHDLSNNAIYIYPEDGRGPHRLLSGADQPVLSSVVSRSAPLLAVIDRGGLTIVDLAIDSRIRRIPANSMAYFGAIGAFSWDDAKIVTAGDSRVNVWDVASGRLFSEFAPEGSRQGENEVALLPDDTLLVASGRGLWRYDLSGNALDVPRLSDSCYGLSVSRNGARLASLRAAAVDVFDIATWSLLCVQKVTGASSTALSPDGERLAVGDLGGRVTLVDAASGRQLWSVSAPGWGRPNWTTPALLLIAWVIAAGWLARRRKVRGDSAVHESTATTCVREGPP